MSFNQLSETIKKQHRTEEEQALIKRAYDFAVAAHAKIGRAHV